MKKWDVHLAKFNEEFYIYDLNNQKDGIEEKTVEPIKKNDNYLEWDNSWWWFK